VKQRFEQSDFEDLIAYMDGELGEPRRSEVARLVEADPVWREELRAMQAVDGALDMLEVPAVPAGLAGRICAGVRQAHKPLVPKFVRWLAPVAAAATVVLAIVIYQHQATRPVAPQPVVVHVDNATIQPVAVNPLAGLADDDQLAVEGKDFFDNYEVVNNFETIQAIDRLEADKGS